MESTSAQAREATRSRKKLGAAFYSYAVMAVIGLATVLGSVGMTYFDAKFMPLVIGGLILALAVFGMIGELVSVLRRPRAASKAAAPVPIPKSDEEEEGGAKKELDRWKGYGIALAWMLGAVAGVYLIGMVPALFVFMTSYMFTHRIKWQITVAATVILVMVVYWGFEVLLDVELPRGYFWEWYQGTRE